MLHWLHSFNEHGFTGDEMKHLADAASVGIAVGALTGYLPALAALFTIVWTGIRIFETKTIQRMLGRAP